MFFDLSYHFNGLFFCCHHNYSKFENTWNGIWENAEKLGSHASEGKDWTLVWKDLDQLVALGLTEVSELVKQDPGMSDRRKELQELKLQLGMQHPLKLKSVTVRLEQDHLEGLEKVVFEFQVLPGGEIFQSEPFNVGPAAPAGSGWVGTVQLTASVPLGPRESFRGAVRSLEDGRELMNVQYPSLSDGGGPGALERPRSGQSGNLNIKSDGRWWRNIEIPTKKDHHLAL